MQTGNGIIKTPPGELLDVLWGFDGACAICGTAIEYDGAQCEECGHTSAAYVVIDDIISTSDDGDLWGEADPDYWKGDE